MPSIDQINVGGTPYDILSPRLSTGASIDGVLFTGAANIIHYGVCSTAADVAEKDVSVTGFSLSAGAVVEVKFQNADSTGSPTLNVSSTGTHTISMRGTWSAGDAVQFVYDGTNWCAVGIMADTSLSVSGAAADAKAAGDALNGVLTYRGTAGSTMDINTMTSNGQWYVTSGNYPNGDDPDNPHFPFTSGAGRIITFGSDSNMGGKIQLVFSAKGDAAFRYRTSDTWYNWRYLVNSSTFVNYLDDTMTDSSKAANAAAVGNLALLGYPTMITTTAQLETLVESKSANDFPRNRVVVIGSSSVALLDGVTIGTKGGLYATLNYRADVKSGAAQIFINRNGFASRFNTGGTWSDWSVFQAQKESVYYVGPNREIKSLTELWMTIGEDSRPKTVYVDPGEYDVFQEYVDNNVPVPPDGTSTANYKPYCANIPSNTKIIGLGDVTLRWEPTPEQITQIEAQIWSVVNVHGGNVEIDNFTIRCKNVRYAIHDDPHNAFPGCRHVFRNIRIYRGANDTGLGNFGVAFGVGWMDKSYYSYENVFVDNQSNQERSIPIAGHEGNTSATAGAYDGAVLNFRDCVFLSDNRHSMKFQTINTTGAVQKIQVLIADCWINKDIWLDQHTNESSGQFFALTLLRSGNPEVRVDIADNPYPVQIYDSSFVPFAITSQPQSRTASAGTSVNFTVGAVGNGLKYQWQYSTDNGETWTNTTITGNKTAQLAVGATTARNGYQYRCIVSASTAAPIASDAATLTVT